MKKKLLATKEVTKDDVGDEIKNPELKYTPDAPSVKYKSILSREEGLQLKNHVEQMRNEWP